MALKYAQPAFDHSLRLPEGEYFPAARKKTGIAIHHTVGGTAASTLNHWLKDRTRTGKRRMVGTAFIIDRDGTSHQVFEPTAWAFQFGLKWPPARKMKFEQRFIGIEIASEGGLTEFEGRLYCFDRISPKTVKPRAEVFDYGRLYRGYRYFDKYEPAQTDQLVELISHLCDTYSIERRVPYPPHDYYGERLADFKGIIGHAMVRPDKTDPAPMQTLWDRIITDCKLDRVTIPQAENPNEPSLDGEALDALFESNIAQIANMSVAAGSSVKGLIMELGRRDTHIRLTAAEAGGHKVKYELVTGSGQLVKRIATALGFERVAESLLQVRNG
jgi:hypothetical protein